MKNRSHHQESPGKSTEAPDEKMEAPFSATEAPCKKIEAPFSATEAPGWQQLTDRELRRMAIEQMEQVGVAWSVDVELYVRSALVPLHNPVTEYLDRCGQWDGQTDHIRQMARRVPTVYELRHGEPYHFSKEEEAAIVAHNAAYLCESTAKAVLLSYFEPEMLIMRGLRF